MAAHSPGPISDLPVLTPELASRFAAIALHNLAQAYPHKLDHVMASDADALPPRALHPAFHASYDWRSCVHMHWLLVHLRRRFPGLPQASTIEDVFDRHLSVPSIDAECAYLERPHSGSFERTYGWAWLLKLALELHACTDSAARRWSAALQPLAEAIEALYLDYLPRADYPIRYGTHSNSAFGLAFAIDYARGLGRVALERVCLGKAHAWFGDDVDAPIAWEPSGADFLSPSLVEAALMRRVLHADGPAFATWLQGFLPGVRSGDDAPRLLWPVRVSDRSDAQIVHLDGLNLARAWCWTEVALGLPAGDPRVEVARRAAERHLAAGLEGLDAATFVGSHWLASFAALALQDSNG